MTLIAKVPLPGNKLTETEEEGLFLTLTVWGGKGEGGVRGAREKGKERRNTKGLHFCSDKILDHNKTG